MQLTLSSVPFSKPRIARHGAMPTAHPRDAGALSQLDQIAAQNLQATRQGLGGAATVLALLGGLVVLGSASMWSSGSDEVRQRPAAAEMPKAVAAESPGTSVVSAPPVTAAVAAPASLVVAAPLVQATEPAAEAVQTDVAVPQVLAATDDAARKARAKQQAEARRKAAQLAAQERALTEENQRLQAVAQQRESERAQQLAEQARQRAAAAEQARLAATQLASDSRRGVGDMCSAVGGFISQQFCHARECRKADHQGDAICVNLRETEAARLRASSER
jgi:hypothetical protein